MENKCVCSVSTLNVQRCSLSADGKALKAHCSTDCSLRAPLLLPPHVPSLPTAAGARRGSPGRVRPFSEPVTVAQRRPLTFMLVGHLLAAGKVKAHQGTETEKEGEVQHEEDVLHGRVPRQSPLARGRPVGPEQPLWHLFAGLSPGLGGSTASPPERSPPLHHARPAVSEASCQLPCPCPELCAQPPSAALPARGQIRGLRAAGFQGPGWHCRHPGQLPRWCILRGPSSRRCPSTGPGSLGDRKAPGNSTSNGDAERAFFRTRAKTQEAPPAACTWARSLLSPGHPKCTPD